MEYIALDVHKAYSLARVEDASGRLLVQQRIGHCKGAIGAFLATRPRGARVAVRARRGHGKAIVAVARHLAEACFWVLSRKVPYEDPTTRTRR